MGCFDVVNGEGAGRGRGSAAVPWMVTTGDPGLGELPGRWARRFLGGRVAHDGVLGGTRVRKREEKEAVCSDVARTDVKPPFLLIGCGGGVGARRIPTSRTNSNESEE